MLYRAIVRKPSANFAEGLTRFALAAPDYARTLQQHESYCVALEQCGLALTRLEADERYPDSTFVEDTAVLTERCAILTRPGAASRLGEVESIRRVLAREYSALHFIHEPGTLDGGDVCEAGNHFLIGISERTNQSGAQQLAGLLASFGYSSSFLDIRTLPAILHLKSGLAYLGDNRMVVIEALRDQEELRDYELIPVNAGEEYAANCLRVNDHVLLAAGYTAFEQTLQDLGYRSISLEVGEFQKMDGGLSCLSLRF